MGTSHPNIKIVKPSKSSSSRPTAASTTSSAGSARTASSPTAIIAKSQPPLQPPSSRDSLPSRSGTFSHPALATRTLVAPPPRDPVRKAITPAVAVSGASREEADRIVMASIISSATASPMSPAPLSMTSKEWVIPPRPKPGRKPATDTPPTKRKAQNRAAQRAFRERRAARVGELEEQLDEEREKHLELESGLRERIQTLETENQDLQTRCQTLENLLERERMNRRESEGLKRSWLHDSVSSLPHSISSQQQQQQQLSHLASGQSSPYARAQSHRGSASSMASIANNRGPTQPISISQIISTPQESSDAPDLTCGSCAPNGPCVCADEVLNSAVMGCGKCSMGTKCECLEAAIKETLGEGSHIDLKRRSSAFSVRADGKKLRSGSTMEIDFTEAFSDKNPPSAFSVSRYEDSTPSDSYVHAAAVPLQQPQPQQPAILPRDPCGFCKDGTYCVCADTASAVGPAPTLLSSVSQQQQTPPPETQTASLMPPMAMEVTATGAIKLPSLHSLRSARANASGSTPTHGPSFTANSALPQPKSSSSCGPNGPGTCAQCLADPKSGLFCRSLAANFSREGAGGSAPPGGCCGGGGAGGGGAGRGCCKSQQKTTPPSVNSSSNKNALSLSCADAYKTLSSHLHFDQATDDLGSWLPLLKAAPRRDGEVGPARQQLQPQVQPQPQQQQPQQPPAYPRHPIEVEAASIMSVLKGFDVRFGKGV